MTTIRVRVKPGSRVQSLERVDDLWIARVRSPPIEGKANRELIGLIADYFDVPRSRVKIGRGTGARVKSVEIDD